MKTFFYFLFGTFLGIFALIGVFIYFTLVGSKSTNRATPVSSLANIASPKIQARLKLDFNGYVLNPKEPAKIYARVLIVAPNDPLDLRTLATLAFPVGSEKEQELVLDIPKISTELLALLRPFTEKQDELVLAVTLTLCEDSNIGCPDSLPTAITPGKKFQFKSFAKFYRNVPKESLTSLASLNVDWGKIFFLHLDSEKKELDHCAKNFDPLTGIITGVGDVFKNLGNEKELRVMSMPFDLSMGEYTSIFNLKRIEEGDDSIVHVSSIVSPINNTVKFSVPKYKGSSARFYGFRLLFCNKGETAHQCGVETFRLLASPPFSFEALGFPSASSRHLITLNAANKVPDCLSKNVNLFAYSYQGNPMRSSQRRASEITNGFPDVIIDADAAK